MLAALMIVTLSLCVMMMSASLAAGEPAETNQPLKWVPRGTLPARGTAQHSLTLAKPVAAPDGTAGTTQPAGSVLRWRTPGVARAPFHSPETGPTTRVVTVANLSDKSSVVSPVSGTLQQASGTVQQASGTLEDIPFAVPDAYVDPIEDGTRSPAPPQELPPVPAFAQPAAELVAQDTAGGPSLEADWQDDPPPAPQPLPSPGAGAGFAPAQGDAKADCDRVYNQRDCCADEERCEGARRLWQNDALAKISLDITPQLLPDETDPYTEETQRDAELAQAPVRTWRDRDGNVLATGRLTNIKRGRLLVLDADNQIVKLAFHDLSDDDLCFLTAWWKVPTECTFGDEVYAGRNWQPTTLTWKASAACHKPLYFEEVQLERYGHSAGPIKQPLLSGAHFFASLVTLPYQAGINPPWECQYALGYYRPGSCAPWLVPPVPLSLRGGLLEAAAFVGGIYIIP